MTWYGDNNCGVSPVREANQCVFTTTATEQVFVVAYSSVVGGDSVVQQWCDDDDCTTTTTVATAANVGTQDNIEDEVFKFASSQPPLSQPRRSRGCNCGSDTR